MAGTRPQPRGTMLNLHADLSGSLASACLLNAFQWLSPGCIADDSTPPPKPQDQSLDLESTCGELVSEGIVAEIQTGQACRDSLTCGFANTCETVAVDCTEGEELAMHEASVLECPWDASESAFVAPEAAAPWVD